MSDSTLKLRLLIVLAAALWIGVLGLLGLYDSFPTGCIMTYMYPTYIPVPPPINASATKYGLYLYHEGWKKIDFQIKLNQLSGVPVLFIPGNGGSYKQVRSLAAESDRAFNGGPLEESLYQASVLTQEEWDDGHNRMDMINGEETQKLEKLYPNHLDWFAVDLDGEHSAMDGRILEEHTEYVVQAIHRILDRYKESFETRSMDAHDIINSLPKSVILVGHSMGGFVARAAVVHEGLRKGAIQTVLTLSSPHLSPPVATQPSLGYYFSRVNNAWRKGYSSSRKPGRRTEMTASSLSHVVVVSVVGGPRDYQVRSKMASLGGIVPSTHGLTIGAPGMLNVWLAMEHQSILWCNQLVVQVSHTLLQIIDQKTGQPFSSHSRRLAVFVTNLRSALPQTFGWMSMNSYQSPNKLFYKHRDVTNELGEDVSKHSFNPHSCLKPMKWSEETYGKDLYIETYTVTILAMDGRRRWLDIKKLGSEGRDHFVLVTNLVPCFGIRVHLWPEKGEGFSVNQHVVEVTRKMVQLPAGPAPRQTEPGGQTEQVPPSGILYLSPDDLSGFRFITLTVAPQVTISGRPPPAASMAVGQFYNVNDGGVTISPSWITSTLFHRKEIQLVENHPLVFNLSFSVSMGVMSPTVELRTSSCGIRNSIFPNADTGDHDHKRLCKLRCFPPAAIVWDPFTGLAMIPNFYSETISVDSSPSLWGPYQGSRMQNIILLVDPHCAYKISLSVSLSTVATRFLLIHGLQIAGLAVAILLFVLMHQTRAWELDRPVPSVLTSLEYNLVFPFPFILLSIIPLLIYAFIGWLSLEATSSFANFVIVSVVCYCFATGAVALLAIIAQIVFYGVASLHIFLKLRCKTWLYSTNLRIPSQFQSQLNTFSSSWVVACMKSRPSLAVMVLSMSLTFCVHPALGLIVLLFVHMWRCYSALCSCLTACSHQDDLMQQTGQAIEKELVSVNANGNHVESSKDLISFGETQLEMFNYGQSLLLLHLIVAAMLIPSLFAWGQRLGMKMSLPWLLDASLSWGIILHGFVGNKLDINIPLVPVPFFWRSSHSDSGLSFVYAIAGLHAYLAGLALAPYRVFYGLAVIGLVSAIIRIVEKRGRTKGVYNSKRQHFHRH